MTIYQGLSYIYDKLIEGVDYQGWAEYIKKLTETYHQEIGNALDIACGTGSTSISLAQFDWRITGVDISLPMLQQARRKAAEAKQDIIFLQQDMRDLELTREYDLVTCFQDGLNYLLSREDLKKAFNSVNNMLSSSGLFIFDLNLGEKYAFSAQEVTSFIDSEEFSLIYETSYLPDEEIWEIRVTGFIREDEKYTKFQELHKEKHHRLENVEESLKATGFKVLDVFDAFTFKPPKAESGRLFIVAQKEERG